MAENWVHTFKITIGLDRLTAMLKQACRQPFNLEVEGHDFNVVPAYRIIEGRFASVEDRDRVRVVLRQLEKEMMAASKMAHPRRAPEATPAARATNGNTDKTTARPSPTPHVPGPKSS
jgi:hypothetical protein